MAALSAKRITKSRGLGRLVRYKMAASTSIYAGGMVMITSAGLATPAAAAASNQGVVGVATESVTSDSSTATYIKVQEGTFLFAGTSLAQTVAGAKCYGEDDQTVDETQGSNEPLAGIVEEFVSATSAWVRMGLAESKL